MSSLKQWLYASISVFVISIVGIVAILCVPFVQRDQHSDVIIQLLVGLAIGTLTSDALLHLLPHAFMKQLGADDHGFHAEDRGHHHEDHEHDHGHEHEHSVLEHDVVGSMSKIATGRQHGHGHSDSVWFGLMALVGIIGFLTFERVVTIISDLSNNRNSKKSNQIRDKFGTEEGKHKHGHHHNHHEHNHNDHQVNNHSLPPKKRHDSEESEKNSSEMDQLNQVRESEQTATGAAASGRVEIDGPTVDEMEGGRKSLSTDTGVGCLPGGPDIKMTTELCHRETVVYQHPDPDRGIVVHLTDHHHHHQHQPAKRAKSLIYMIVTGDGLHNFCDGLAIGIAFAGGISGGFSTSIAVLCHELPHEVGDFAVLLKAGLSVKRALVYNTMSAFLCLIGATIGVFIGYMEDAWLSALIAGMFLYIALVDMIPQLDCCPTSSGTTRAFKLTVQLVGICIGVTIMCVISIYESRLEYLLN